MLLGRLGDPSPPASQPRTARGAQDGQVPTWTSLGPAAWLRTSQGCSAGAHRAGLEPGSAAEQPRGDVSQRPCHRPRRVSPSLHVDVLTPGVMGLGGEASGCEEV